MKIFTKTSVKIGAHIALGCVLGLFFILVFLSSSSTFKEFVQGQIVEQLQHNYHCQCLVNVDSVDLLSCRIECSNLQLLPEKGMQSDLQNWSITAEKMTICASWLSLIFGSTFKLSVSFNRMIMLENYDKTPSQLMQFYTAMFNSVAQGFFVYDVVSFNESIICFKKIDDEFQIHIPLVCYLRSEQSCTRLQCYIHDGFVGFHDHALLSNIDGSVLCDIPFINPTSVSGQVQLNYVADRSGQEVAGFCVGSIKRGSGEFSIKTQDRSIVLDPIKIHFDTDACWCETMIAATAESLQYFGMPELLEGLVGTVGLSVRCNLFDILKTLQATLIFDDIMYQSKPIISGAKLSILDHNKTGFSGMFTVRDQPIFKVDVALKKKTTICSISNVQNLDVPFNSKYKILKDNCQFVLTFQESGDVKLSYQAIVQDDKNDTYQISGLGTIVDGLLQFEGTGNNLNFQGAIRLNPQLNFESFCLKRDKNLLIDFNTDASDRSSFIGSVDFSVLHDVLEQPFKMSFTQPGSFTLKGSYENGVISATLQTHCAHIRVPYVYNVIQNVSATCEWNIHQKECLFKNIAIELYEGKISCSQAKINFDKNLAINFLHAPLMVHDVLLSWNKGIYGLVSGSILAQKKSLQDVLDIQGQLMVQKSELKENIFSAEFQNIVSGTSLSSLDYKVPINVDVSLFTKQALQIDTSFLTAQAVLGVNVKGLLPNSDLSGSMKLLSGVLHFPYKPLDIVDGRLLFMPEQPLDPMIEFLAKGKVKRYQITLKVWGSATDPHMQFESEPYLSEEQIMSLLLIGIEDQSLSLMIPAFLYQKLKDIMFGPAISNVKLKSVFDTLLQSLKYVRFIPQFSNQTGRGGVRGIFEIDATQHLQGTIDTNFSHLEDTKFDVDYAATDDVTLRLQKDGPSTYGGQVEFRWKFS